MIKELLHTLFEHCAVEDGHVIAVQEEHHQISYNELNNKSNQLGYLLRSLGVSEGDVVGVMVPPGIRSILGLLSIFKVGGIYMPMSLSHSQRRLQQMFLESELRVLLIESGQLAAVEVLLKDLSIKVPYLVVFPNQLEDLQGVNSSGDWLDQLGGHGVVMFQHLRVLGYSDEGYEELACRMEDYSEDNHDLDLLPDSASYVFYTSGSTGSGKAILGIHQSLSQYVHWHIGQWDVGPGSRISQLAPLTFDASLKDILVGLCSGGTVCVPGEGTRMHPLQLLDWLDSQRVTILQCVPSLFRLLTKCLSQTGAEAADVLPYLRHVLLAGERLYGKDVDRWRRQAGGDIELVNLYGLTETTILKTCYRLDAEHVWQPGELIPVGYPISNALVAVLNNKKLCKPGAVGEIYLKSHYMSKGYWHDAAMTANLFVQNPLVEDREDIVCRTGDLGRYREDGSLEVLGRKDDQVKLHGVRVELSEVSSALLALPGVDQVELVVDQDEDYQQELICYYTGQERVSDWFRTELSIGLNAEYFPSYYVWLDEFPLNVNGKVDRKLLPKPIALEDTDYESPVDELELRLSEIWQVVLGDRRIGRKASFFTLGGSSLKAMQLVSHIYKEFEVLLKIGDLFSRPTLAGQAALIRAQQREVYEEIEPVAIQEDYALSHGQRRLWVLDQLENQQGAYSRPIAYRLEGSVSVKSLRASFLSLVARHESLRTVFVVVEGEPRQKILSVEGSGFELDYEDLRDDPQAVERVKQISEQMAGTAFDLSTGPLLRVKLLQIEETSYVFVLSMHHIVSDEWSMQVLFKEVLLLYNAYVSGESNPLPPLSIHYKDYAHWQMGQLSGDRLRGDHSYWMDQLSGELPLLELPTDYPRPSVKTYNGNNVSLVLDPGLSAKLKMMGDQEGVTLFMILLSTVYVLLYRYTGQKDLIVGTPVAGREHLDLEDQIGFFINILALRMQISGEESFKELLGKVKEVSLESFAHQQYPFDKLVEELPLERDLSRSPLFDVMMVLQNQPSVVSPVTMQGVDVSAAEVEVQTSKFDLTFSFFEHPERIYLVLNYNSDLFSGDRIEQLLSHYSNLLSSLLDDPVQPVGIAEMLSNHERTQLLDDFNATFVDYPEQRTLVDLFEQQVHRTPDHVALVFEDQSLTYEQVNQKANQLAHYFRRHYNIEADDLVGLLLERSEMTVIAMLSVLKSGG
ncbi:condensation domain-containing protein, partial [Fulvivirgaceae bacterium BMA12]|nr:condensation domain-containing protein [Fulvivirgaceae bacterium BMA12]